MSRALALLPLLLLALRPAAAAEPLVADLSTHLIAITTGFTGKDVVLFGAAEGLKDGNAIIVIVHGPNGKQVVRRKGQVAGIWMNTLQVTFTRVPAYYAVYSTKPLDEIMPPALRALNEIGAENLHFGVVEKDRTPQQVAEFRAALLRQLQRERLYLEASGGFNVLDQRLFHVSLDFPANVPVGTYIVDIRLVHDKVVIAAQTASLIIAPGGIDADLFEFATRQALAYGLIAVMGAAMAGWLASLPFRHA